MYILYPSYRGACMKKIVIFYVLILTFNFIFINCSKDENPVKPPETQSDLTYTHILEVQENLNNILTNLLTRLDTISALDSVRKLFLKDTLVSNAYFDDQGLNVQYKNGVRGGIFVDGADNEQVLDKPIKHQKNNNLKYLQKESLTIPTSKKVLFINPHYHERSSLLFDVDFFVRYLDNFDMVKYDIFNKLDNDATLDVFANMSSYGYIHIYSHGRSWPNKTNLSEVYLLTGEKVSNATNNKYADDINAGNIIIQFSRSTNANTYFINPTFIAKYNNFQESGSLIYGGFCFSFLGNWANQLVTNAKAKVYMGFDWSVSTKFNIDLAMILSDLLCWDDSLAPQTVGSFMIDSTVKKTRWSTKEHRWVTLKYNGASDFALWNNLIIKSLNPERGTIGTSVTIIGTGFGNSQGLSSVKFNGVVSNVSTWSDTIIRASVPNGATSGSVVVNVNNKESNGMLFIVNGPEITSITPDSSYIGDIISIGGKNFGTNMSLVKVFFNSISATEITEVKDYYIKVKVPENAMSGNIHVEINGVPSNNQHFKVMAETPVIDHIEPSSALPGNYIYLYGSWKSTNITPPNTSLKIGGITYPIDPNLNWNANSYLKLLLSKEISTGMQEVSLIYEGKESNKTNLYVGIPLEVFIENQFRLIVNGFVYLELLKPDQSFTSTVLYINTDSMIVNWENRTFSSTNTTSSYIDSFNGKISEDGMKIVQLNIHKKYLTSSGDINISLKEDESISLDSIYYSYYTNNYFLYHYNSGPDYKAIQEEILSKFDINGVVEIIPGEIYTIKSFKPKEGETSYSLVFNFQ